MADLDRIESERLYLQESLGKSIFPTFSVNVPMPKGTAEPARPAEQQKPAQANKPSQGEQREQGR